MPLLPRTLYQNEIAQELNAIRKDYANLSGRGFIRGLMCADQDAKIIAVDKLFDDKLNIWDLAALGAALYGVAKQGRDFFDSDELERGSLIFKDMQFLVKSIGSFNLDEKNERELVIIALVDRRVNLGLIILQMEKYALRIRKKVENNSQIKQTLKLSEEEMRKHINAIKKELFKKAASLNYI
ncbi:MAG: hypothetical protein ACTSU2_13060 [Promethearchaeota archaeon]